MRTNRVARRERAAKAPLPVPDKGALLYSRPQVARLLNCSTMTVIRLTKQGALTPIRLAGTKGKVFFRATDIYALVEQGRR